MKDKSNISDDNHDGEEEDAISLSDFPITASKNQTNCKDQNSTTYHDHDDHQSSDFFEFFNYDLTKDISHADDIILCGKLIPFHNQQQQQHQTSTIKHRRSESHRMTFRDDGEQRNFHHHRRWESLSELTSSSHWNSPKTGGQVHNSRSVDYQKLPRNSSVKSIGRADNSKVLKPRWYVLMFGSFRFRPEMELRDIKNRQVRRAPAATMFQPLDGGGKKPVSPPNGRKSSWCLLKALVCRGNVTDDVTASVGCMPKA
ncbi:hypothetical protein RHMOL_Rhmol01G0004100 [Rhododendron molle]|uniref:Uncharacterized protein n=1 Tax=Rhododendron molle TaxID=49168 RepID=A0ACC0PY25_RHOML|nr:hypothetical protein RHMOL_Rhmol01G0004100 [Rhododendron molle]